MFIIHAIGATCCQMTDKILSDGSLRGTFELNWYELSKSQRCFGMQEVIDPSHQIKLHQEEMHH